MNSVPQTFPSWRQSLAASLNKSRSKARSKYFQIASVNANGLPKNRTVVFRGFVEGTNHLSVITDSRSNKYEQWQNNDFAEICWYFDLSREQYRIMCKTSLVDALSEHQDIRKDSWQRLSMNAKAQFFWPCPGDEYDDKKEDAFDVDDAILKDATAPDNFVVVVLLPQEIDYLNLKTQPQTREISRFESPRDGNERYLWETKQVNP